MGSDAFGAGGECSYRSGVRRLMLAQSPLSGESRATVCVGAAEALQRQASRSLTAADTVHPREHVSSDFLYWKIAASLFLFYKACIRNLIG